MRPLIGVSLDQEASGSFSPAPYAALRVRYFEAIFAAGGLPVGIAGDGTSCSEYAKRLDGILIPGGECAFPEEWYIKESQPAPYPPSKRLDMDIGLAKYALAHDIPLLGICHGMQVMACLSGCKMTRNLNAHIKTDIDHKNGAPKEEICHDIDIAPNTVLYDICAEQKIGVNSYHQEAIIEINGDVMVNAKSLDGVIEAISLPNSKFAIGVQWHPEYLVTKHDKVILNAFIKAAENG